MKNRESSKIMKCSRHIMLLFQNRLQRTTKRKFHESWKIKNLQKPWNFLFTLKLQSHAHSWLLATLFEQGLKNVSEREYEVVCSVVQLWYAPSILTYAVVYCIIITSVASSFFSAGSAAASLLLKKYAQNFEAMISNHSWQTPESIMWTKS